MLRAGEEGGPEGDSSALRAASVPGWKGRAFFRGCIPVSMCVFLASDFKAISHTWLVVLTILKNISQWEALSHILWKTKNVPNHQPEKMSNMGLSDNIGKACKFTRLSWFAWNKYCNFVRAISSISWLVVDLPLWKMMEFVSWDDFPFPIFVESHSKFHGSSHHQPVSHCYSNY